MTNLLEHVDNVARPTDKLAGALWADWAGLWNGDFSKSRIVSPSIRVHAAMLDGSSNATIKGRDDFINWVKQARAPFDSMSFNTEVGPLLSGEFVIGRWTATGTYRGGIPGAKAEPGTVVTFAGTDILRVKEGQIVEYWISSDTLSMLMQLKVV